MPLRMRVTAPVLLWAVACVALLSSVSGVMRAGLGLQSEISLQLLDTLWSNKANLVTYAKCDASMCPPLEPPCKKPECPKVELQNTKEPPPKGYECHCEDPNEVPECGCLNECCAQRKKEYEEQKACECRLAMRVPSKAITRIMDPNAKPPPPPRNEKRKFFPRQTEPNPLPPIKEVECRPNVHGISPGNCRRGNSMSTCQNEASQCKDIKTASKGFVAATLTDDVQPDDEEEDCTHEGTADDSTAFSEPNANGDHAKAHASVYNHCTKKSRYVPAADIFVHPPVVIRKAGDPVPLSEEDPSPRSGPMSEESGSGSSGSSSGPSSASTISQSLSSLLSSLSSSMSSGSSSRSGSSSSSGSGSSSRGGSMLVPSSSSSSGSSGSQGKSITLSSQSLQSIISKAVSSALSQSSSSKSSSSSGSK